MKPTNIIFAAGLGLAAAFPGSPAMAQFARTAVSLTGNDSNICTLAAPCRTFQAAYNQTNAGGEIVVLGTAGYGPLTISKAISIVNPGAAFEAGIVVPSGGTGISISAGPNDAISLRGITVDGQGVGNFGIVFFSGASLTIENCVVRHLAQDGIDFMPSTASSLSVSNTVASDNGLNGILVEPTGAIAAAANFSRVEVNNNGGFGIYVTGEASTGTVKATVSESVAANNSNGFNVFTAAPHAPTTFTVFHSVVANNTGNGFTSIGVGATLRVAQSMVTGNVSAWQVAGSGVLATYGDNYFDGNGGSSGSTILISRQ